MRDHKEKMKDNSVDFLLYTYFGKVKDDFNSEVKIVETAIERAYQDATLQAAYNSLLPTKKDKSSEATAIRRKSVKAHDDASIVLKEGVENLLNPDNNFDELHEKICGNLVDIYCDDYEILKEDGNTPCFTPGNAQKWVNMTMKNLYVICGMLMVSGCNDSIGAFSERVLNRAQYFHIPIDSYILEAWKDIPSSDSSYIKTNGDSVYVKYNDDFTLSNKRGTLTTAWSAMEDYKIYLELRDKCASKALDKSDAEDEWPIEWESVNWIKISEERKERKKQKDSATGES